MKSELNDTLKHVFECNICRWKCTKRFSSLEKKNVQTTRVLLNFSTNIAVSHTYFILPAILFGMKFMGYLKMLSDAYLFKQLSLLLTHREMYWIQIFLLSTAAKKYRPTWSEYRMLNSRFTKFLLIQKYTRTRTHKIRKWL